MKRTDGSQPSKFYLEIYPNEHQSLTNLRHWLIDDREKIMQRLLSPKTGQLIHPDNARRITARRILQPSQGRYPELEDKLMELFSQRRKDGNPVTGNWLQVNMRVNFFVAN
jgi:hypothetical protein